MMDKARFTKRQHKKKSGNSSRQDMEMGGESQGEEEELRRYSSSGSKSSSRKLRFRNKPFIDYNAVVPVHIPRKLRSAMAKRTRESLSPPLSYKMKVPQKPFGTEMHQNLKLKSADQAFIGTITKEEVEVAETLALVLPDDKLLERRVGERSDEKSKQDTKALQDQKEDSPQSQLTHSAAENHNPSSGSNLEGSSQQNLFTGHMIIGHPIGYGNNKVDLASGSSTALADILRTSVPSNGAMVNGVRLADPSELGVFPEFCHATGMVQPSLYNQKLLYGMWPVVNPMQKEEPQRPVLEDKGSGTLQACNEGMYKLQSLDNEHNVPSRRAGATKLPATKLPAWLNSGTPSNRPGSTETPVLNDKVKLVDRSKRKRCVSHVYLCHLIRSYQILEKTPRGPVTAGQLQSNERMTLGFTATNGLASSNGVIPMDSTDAPNISTDNTKLTCCGKNPSEMPIRNLLEQRFHSDQQVPISSSGNHSSEKKNCDFLSLSSGGTGVGVEPLPNNSNNINQNGKGLVSLAQGQVTYLPPVVQHHPLMAFGLPHVRSSSQSQAPQYVSNPFYYPTHPNHVGLVKQQHQVWAAQLTSQHRPGSEPGTNQPRWPNGIRESTSVMPSSLAQPGFFSSPVELQSSNGSQQQQMHALSSSPVVKSDCRTVPHSCVESGGVIQSSTSPHLQLVCSGERS